MGSQRRLQRAKKNFKIWKIERNPWKTFGPQVRCTPQPPVSPLHAGARRLARMGSLSLCCLVMGVVDT